MNGGKAGIAVLGAGVSGLAAGMASGAPVFEASEVCGGICGSYYRAFDGNRRYRFEVGGGHWIWGGDATVWSMLARLTPFRTYRRSAAVFLPGLGRFVPYPIQDHLGGLPAELAGRAARELFEASVRRSPGATLDQWLEGQFGPTLHALFFGPFHQLYTAGLSRTVAPQDAAKSPLDLEKAIGGLLSTGQPASGYNASFRYPNDGLDALVRGMAARCREIRPGCRVVRIDTGERVLFFEDGRAFRYRELISTLPLNAMQSLAQVESSAPPDPYTSVLVVNIGARKGPDCPPFHWVYFPASASGFHRVGFYSNVDPTFAGASAGRVSVYVEIACRGGSRLGDAEREAKGRAAVAELQDMGWIGDVEVVDATWVECAYTWANPGSGWAPQVLEELRAAGIHQVGRYGRWASNVQGQGVMQSVKDGLACGAALGVLQG